MFIFKITQLMHWEVKQKTKGRSDLNSKAKFLPFGTISMGDVQA
jgi:hypothetical protein